MFLTRLRVLRSDPERGSALMGVIGVMAVTVLIAATVSAVSINTANFTTANRAEVQSRAAADAGIDVAFARIAAGDFQCLVGPRPGDPQFAVEIEYFVGGAEQPCSGEFSGAPEDARITSTGLPDQPGTGRGGDAQNHTVVAEVDITVTPGTATSLPFDKAVFTDGELTIATNNPEFLESSPGANDADTYTNGAYICRTQVDMQGTIRAQKDLKFENTCMITGDTWSAGNISFSSQASVRGSVYAAGTGTVDLGQGHVDGDVITNGSVLINTSSGRRTCASGGPVEYTVCGSVVALGGGVSISNGAGIGRYLVAKGNISIGQANSSVIVGADASSQTGSLTIANPGTGNIQGSARVAGSITAGTRSIVKERCSNGTCVPAPSLAWPDVSRVLPPELGYPAGAVNAPPRESMPKVASDAASLAQWEAEGWVVEEFTTTEAGKTTCQQAKEFIAGQPTVKTLVVVRDCGSALSWANATITLKADLAIMSLSGFASDNNITIRSDGTTVRNLMWLVPSDAPNITWNAVPDHPGHWSPSCTGTGGDINMGNSNFDLVKVNWLVYSPCYVNFGNSADGFAGQVYSGKMGQFPKNTEMQYAPMSVPGASVPGGGTPTPASSTAVITARYDAAR